jgi:hypothetical protein
VDAQFKLIPVILLLTLWGENCVKTPLVSNVNYRVHWQKEKPFELVVEASISGPKPIKVTWMRPLLSEHDHLRGHIEYISTDIEITPEGEASILLSQENHLNYKYTFLMSDSSEKGFFKNSRSDGDYLFVQAQDLFLIPRSSSSTMRFDIEFDFPDDFHISAGWPEEDGKYFVESPNQLFNSFIVAGKFRNFESNSQNPIFRLAIDDALPQKNDSIIHRSITRSFNSLSKDLAPIDIQAFDISILETKASTSMAMRRGNSIVMGIPKNLGFDLDQKKRIAHEMIHLFLNISDDASWFEEGLSEHLSWLSLIRSGQIDQEEYFQELANAITRLNYLPHPESMQNAIRGLEGEDFQGFAYDVALLGVFSIDATLRSKDLDYGIENLFINAQSENKPYPVSIKMIDYELRKSNFQEGREILKKLASGQCDIIRYLNLAGLQLQTTDYTLLETRQKTTGRYARLLPTDNIISIDNQKLEKDKWNQYIKNNENKDVLVEIERNGERFQQIHKIIPKYSITPKSIDLASIWIAMIRENMPSNN